MTEQILERLGSIQLTLQWISVLVFLIFLGVAVLIRLTDGHRADRGHDERTR